PRLPDRIAQKVTKETKVGRSQFPDQTEEWLTGQYSPDTHSLVQIRSSFLGCERSGRFWTTLHPGHPLLDTSFAIGRVQAQYRGLFPCLLTRWRAWDSCPAVPAGAGLIWKL